MADKWYQNLIPSLKNAEVSQLKEKLDIVVGELKDQVSYDVKFFDAEGSTGFQNGSFEFGGIDQTVNAAFLQKLFTTEPWVYIAVMAVAKTISGLPMKGEKKTRITQTVVNDFTQKPESVDQDVWIDASGEKIFRCFANPNKFTTRAEFLMLLVIDLLVCGQYYVYLDSDVDLTTVTDATAGDPASPFARLRQLMASDTPIKGMYRIPPQLTRPAPSEAGPGVACYEMDSEGGCYAFSTAEIIHVKLPNPMNSIEGLSPLIPALKPVLLDRYSTEHIIRFYKSGARLGGIIETGKALNKEQLARFQRSFENNYTGRANHHRTLILPPEMSYKAIEANPAEQALLEFCKYNRDVILAIYNVPPIKVGVMDNANYANALVQLKIFFEDTIKPLLVFIEDGFNASPACFPDQHLFHIKFDLSQVESLKENFKDKADAGKAMIEAGLSVNEVRKRAWNLGPVQGGEKVKTIEDMGKPTPIFASAPAGSTKTEEQQGDMAAISSDITPTKLTFIERVNQLVAEFCAKGDPLRIAVPKAIAQAIQEGLKPEDPNDPKGGGSSTPNSDGGGTPDQSTLPTAGKLDSASNAAIIPVAIGKEEEEDDEKAGAITLDQFLRDRLSQMGDAPIDPSALTSLIAEFDATGGSAPAPKMYRNGMSKAHIVEHWKGFIDKTNPLILTRTYEVQKFFKAVKSTILNSLGANIKSYGLHKARDEDDVDEILKLENFEKELKEYAKNVDKALEDAYRLGYVDTLGNFEFTPPNKKAVAQLQSYAAARVTGIMETTREQMKSVLSEAFEEGVAMGEVSSRIQDKFKEIDQGRAVTIARTETLTAVSMGRQEKREDWQKEFPDRKLMKMWVSAQDDKVRDSHQEYDGEAVEAGAEFAPGLKFPRDPDCTDPSEVINCRCTDITYDSEDEDLIKDTLPKKEEDESEESDDVEEKSLEDDDKGGPGSGPHPGNGPKPKPRAPKKPKPAAEGARIDREKPVSGDKETMQVIKDTQKEFDTIAEANPDLARATRSWSNSNYKNIRLLQQGKTAPGLDGDMLDRTKKQVAELEDNFSKFPAYSGPVTRELSGVDISTFKEGATMTMDAHSSFTAKDSWGNAGAGQKASVRLVVPGNKSGRAIWGMSTMPDEMEVLVPKGTSYKIGKIVPGNPAEVHLEEVGGKAALDISAVINEAMNQDPHKK